MSTFLKYSILFLVLLMTSSDASAWQRKNKKKVTKTSLQSKKKKSVKKSNKKGIKSKKPLSMPTRVKLEDIVKQVPIDIPVLKDSTPAKVVSILSAFKPQLKSVVKINFTNAAPIVDTQSVHYAYQVPGQNLSFSYRPIALNPLAIVLTDPPVFTNKTNVKVGFGNYLYQVLNLNMVNVGVKAIHHWSVSTESSEGVHHLQKYRNSKVDYQGNFMLTDSSSILTNFFATQSQSYRYGLVPDTLSLPTSQYEQKYTEVGLKLVLLNKIKPNNKLYYKPQFELAHLSDFSNKSNTYIALSSPLSHPMKGDMTMNYDFNFSYSQMNSFNSSSNTLFRVDPSLNFNKWKWQILLGVSPIYTSTDFNLYPNFQLQHQLKDTTWSVKAGWTTKTNNTQYANLLNENPWIVTPTVLKLTTQQKQFIQLEVNASKNLQYGFGLSLNTYSNLPLFNKEPLAITSLTPDIVFPDNLEYTNRIANGLRYVANFESKAKTIELEAHLNYQFSDQFSVQNQFNYTQFNYLKDNEKPWGFVPLKLNSTFFWTASQKLLIDGSFNFLSGIESSTEGANYIAQTLKPVTLLNVGATYKLSIPWKLWIQSTNLLNSQYQRWGDYPSLGVQINAGVVYSFHK